MKRFENKLIRSKGEIEKPDSTTTSSLENGFVPAFLLHITELAVSLQSGHASSIVKMENVDNERDAEDANNNSQCVKSEDKPDQASEQQTLPVPTVSVGHLILSVLRIKVDVLLGYEY